MKKIFVTGATGYIGQSLAASLVASHNVIAPVRSRSKQLPSQVVQHPGIDLRERVDWAPLLEGVDVIVHLAGKAHVVDSVETGILSEYMEINCDVPLSLASVAADCGVKRFVYISSIRVNGEQSTVPFTESTTVEPADAYALSKHQAEIQLQRLSSEKGIEIVIIRPPLVIGPNAPGNVQKIVQWARGNWQLPLPLGSTGNRRSLIGLTNLVSFIETCIDHPKAAQQTFLVSDSEDLSTTQLFRAFAAAFGKRPFLIPVPAKAMKMLFTLMGRRNIAVRLFGDLQVDSAKASDLLGWKPETSFAEQCAEIAQIEA